MEYHNYYYAQSSVSLCTMRYELFTIVDGVPQLLLCTIIGFTMHYAL